MKKFGLKPFDRWGGKRIGHFEVRPDDRGDLDEIVAIGCAIHVERMSGHHWFMLVEMPDGTEQRFWFGAANGRSRVDFTHSETVRASPSPMRSRKQAGSPR